MDPINGHGFGRINRYTEPLVPLVSLLLVYIPIAVMRPGVRHYNGLHTVLSMSAPIVLATVGQMMAMSIGEIDFSLGNLVSLVTCIAGTVMPKNLPLAFLMLAGIIVVYMAVGAFLHLKKLPSIIVTIGLSFIWWGLAVTIQPKPGGTVPAFIVNVMNWRPPLAPLPILIAVLLAFIGHGIMFKSYFGILCRGVGGNLKSIQQAGHSVLRIRIMVFALVGVFGILSGLALAGLTGSADPLVARNYTLLAVAAVILGGGAFAGGKVSAFGAVMGALTMHLITTLLMILKISPDWQAGSQGVIILLALFIGGVFKRGKKVHYI